jgi:hypothetical protein
MKQAYNMHEEKLELMRLIIETSDPSVLENVRSALIETANDSFELSDAHLKELRERTRLRREGKLKTSSWEEVESRIRSEKNGL